MLRSRRGSARPRTPLGARGTRRAAGALLLAAMGSGLALAGGPPPRVTPIAGADLAAAIHSVNPDRGGDVSAVLVNVWATWCLPCLEELPDVLRLRREFLASGLRVVLVSGDFPDQLSAVEEYLARLGVDFETFIKDGPDMEFIDALYEEWSGAMPATLVYDGRGRLVQFREGKATYEELESWVRDALEAAERPGLTKETP